MSEVIERVECRGQSCESDQKDVETKDEINDVSMNEANGSVDVKVVQSNIGELNEKELNDDAYKYLQLDEYTTEKFKLEIQNLHRHCTHSELKQVFKKKFKLTLKKVKIFDDRKSSRAKFAYVSLSNEEEREKAIKLVDGFVHKGCKLKVIKAKPVPDPRIRTRDKTDQRNKINYDELTEDALQQLLFNQVCPLYKEDYANSQLQGKQNSHRRLLAKVRSEILNLHKNNQNNSSSSARSVGYNQASYLEKCLEPDVLYEGIRHAEEYNHYRNKCEFTVGKGADGRIVIGFRLGSYSDNKVKVVKPLDCPLLNDKMMKMIDLIEEFLNSETSDLQAFDIHTHEGQLKQITMRTTERGCMLIVTINRTGLNDEQLKNETNKLKVFVQERAPFCTSLYVQYSQIQRDESKHENVLEHVYGDLHLAEKMRNGELLFRISPLAFFQINLKACEILYDSIAELAGLDRKCVLLDICCGVGTIGICMANKVRQVIGIEMNKDAVDDAVYNAKSNGVDNIEFITGLAEKHMSHILHKVKQIGKDLEIVAILDPPRSGLNNSIIKLIRTCNEITKLIYVSCEPKFSRQNLIDLCKPPSKAYLGMPFSLVRSFSVDMFPHTPQCELVTLFTRDTLKKIDLKGQVESSREMQEEKSEANNIVSKSDECKETDARRTVASDCEIKDVQ